jgi:hypothetical protein
VPGQTALTTLPLLQLRRRLPDPARLRLADQPAALNSQGARPGQVQFSWRGGCVVVGVIRPRPAGWFHPAHQQHCPDQAKCGARCRCIYTPGNTDTTRARINCAPCTARIWTVTVRSSNPPPRSPTEAARHHRQPGNCRFYHHPTRFQYSWVLRHSKPHTQPLTFEMRLELRSSDVPGAWILVVGDEHRALHRAGGHQSFISGACQGYC